MTTPEGQHIPEQPYDDEEDRLANQTGSYAVARFMRNEANSYSTPPTWSEIEADREGEPKKPLSSADRSRIAKAAIGPQYGQEAGVGYDESKPPEHQNFPPISDDQAIRNRYFAQNWREVGEQAIRDGTHSVDEDE